MLYKNIIINKTSQSEAKYKTYKNKLTAIPRFAEKDYYFSLLEINKNNTKKIWHVINCIIKKKRSKITVPLEFMSEGKSIKGHKNVANGFNDFFYKRRA